MFVDLVRGAQACGEIDPGLSPESVSQVMVGLYHGFITQKLVDPDMNVQQYAQVMRALFGGTFWRGRADGAGADKQPPPSGALRH
jgi:hypothetical protein